MRRLGHVDIEIIVHAVLLAAELELVPVAGVPFQRGDLAGYGRAEGPALPIFDVMSSGSKTWTLSQ